ncbi:MAG: pentapeptide repeat-containing protein [Bacteroidetes bacterium]|nr:pentapeptide repeat-containing protein [Bacteroidota bacterium]
MHTRLICIFAFCMACYSCSSRGGDSQVNAADLHGPIARGENLVSTGSTISGDLVLADSTDAISASPVQHISYVHGALVFHDCTFRGRVAGSLHAGQAIYSATLERSVFFDNCVFEEEVNFTGATIQGACTFTKCTFKKPALFNQARFAGEVSFAGCTFLESAGFQQSTFMSSAFFNEVHFERESSFMGTYFYRDATFNLASFDGYADFTQASFYSHMLANYTHSKKNMVLSECTFRGRAEFLTADWVRAEIENSTFYGRTLFDKATISQSFSLHGSRFIVQKPSAAGYKADKLDISDTQVMGSKLEGL